MSFLLGLQTQRKFLTVRLKIGLLLTIGLALLGGCGDGGGGNEEVAAPTPTVGLSALALTPANMAGAAKYASGPGEWVLQSGQLAVDVTNRARSSDGGSIPPSACPNGGLMTVSLQDRDGNARVSSGDRLVALMQDCAVTMMNAILNGTVTVDLTAVNAASTEALSGSIDFGATGVALSAPQGATPGATVRMRGSLAFDWSLSSFATTLRVISAAADDFRLTGEAGATTITEAFRAVDVSKALRFDEARSNVSMALQVDSEVLGGKVSISTPQVIQAYLNTYPEAGLIEVRGDGNAVLRIKPRFTLSSDHFDAELDRIGDGATATANSYRWTDAVDGYLWWDGQAPLNQGALPFNTRLFSTTDFNYTLGDFASPDVREVFRFQFNRPPAAGYALYYRFRDNGSTLGLDFNLQNVSATVERQGALTLIKPSSQLKYSRHYTLEVSSDGLNWNSGLIQVRDVLGNSATFSGTLGSFATGDNLRAVIIPSGQQLTTATDTVQLSAASSISKLRPIASYRWRQLNGTPLEFSAPQAAVTSLRWGSAVPTAMERIKIELEVTDTAGETATVEVVISSLNLQQASGRVLYFRGAPGDYISSGQTVLATDSTGSWGPDSFNNGYVSYYYSDAGGSWWSLDLAGASGAPLSVGAYENAVRAPFHGNQNGVSLSGSGRGCNQIVGRFDVIEISTNALGVIEKLAVDFEQHCESAQAPPLMGSLRINSSVPLRP